MPDHGYTISSPCEPNGLGELKSNYPLFIYQFIINFCCVYYDMIFTMFPEVLSKFLYEEPIRSGLCQVLVVGPIKLASQ